MSFKRWLLLNTAFLTAACGASRSTRSGSCSAVKSIADDTMPVAATFEKYDPSVVLLLFKATSDKLTIESRCNARLVNKIVTKHKKSDGSFEDIGDNAIDFSKLHVRMESGEANLELQTSAHCFFRIWDSRVEHQVKSNPSIAAEPIRSFLRDMKTRYQLYRSMLTTPQTIVAFLPDRTPVTFKYKLPVTSLYEKFFAEIDKDSSGELKLTVGREFSKASVIVDELIRNECDVTQTALNRIDRLAEGNGASLKRKEITDISDALSFMSSVSGTLDLPEFIRKRLTSSGRRRLCFSQTDMVVTPIILAEPTTAVQQSVLAGIETELQKKIDNYLSHINGTTTATDKFIPEITATTTPPAIDSDIDSCSLAATRPGLVLTDVFAKRMEKSYINSWSLVDIPSDSFFPAFKQAFPSLKKQVSSSDVIHNLMSNLVWKAGCELAGLEQHSSGTGCKTVVKTNSGRCPSTTSEADFVHDRIKLSLRLASTSAIHMLRRMRDASALSLTMPFAELRDYISFACESSDGSECSQAGKIKTILDTLAPQAVVATGTEDVELTGDKFNLSVTAVSDDLQFLCKFTPVSGLGTKDISGKLFRDFSEDSQTLLLEGLTPATRTYRITGARFLYSKCITAGMKRLYNTFETSTGLQHGLKFTQISFVKTNRNDFGGRTELSNAEVLQAGRPVSIPFAGMFIGDSAESLSSSELAARLIGGPHVELSYCKTGTAEFFCQELAFNLKSASMMENVTGELQLVRANMNFSAKVPSWISEKEKSKYGEVSFPDAKFSAESARYYLSAGDSGTTTFIFGLWPTSMLSTVDDVPVSGGLAVIPSTGGQKVQSGKGDDCR
jgi:hypothetical protein